MITVPHIQQDACPTMVRETLRSSCRRYGLLWCGLFCAEIDTVSAGVDHCAKGACFARDLTRAAAFSAGATPDTNTTV